MRVVSARTWSAQDVAASYARWWREAGLHSATSGHAHGWLAEPVAEAPVAPSRVAEAAPAVPSATVTPIRPALAPAPAQPMPGDLASFRAWLAQDGAQPEAAWTGPIFVPPAKEQARLIVLCDMPDVDASDGALPFADAAARFVTAMLGAIGVKPDEAAFAPLAMRRPPGGLLDDATTVALTVRMRHYLGLARPRAALILGDRTSRALLAAGAPLGAANLPEINHAGGTVPVAALASPDLLMRRPLAKAASWQTLRLLSGVLN